MSVTSRRHATDPNNDDAQHQTLRRCCTEHTHMPRRLFVHTCSDARCARVDSVHLHISVPVYTPALAYVHVLH
jgi:hypothetical protein